MILFDANLLVHAHAAHSPFHGVASQLRDQAAHGELTACVTPQVLCEFFAICTDARRFQPALSPKQATHEIRRYWQESRFRRILPTAGTMARLVDLLTRQPLGQQRVFDAFLVATMLENGVRTIYTRNVKDFEIYHELQVINPLVAAARPAR